MAIMTERDLDCFLCRKQFREMYGDFIFAPEIICDDCREELSQLADDELLKRVTTLMARWNLVDAGTAEHVLQVIRRPRPAPPPWQKPG